MILRLGDGKEIALDKVAIQTEINNKYKLISVVKVIKNTINDSMIRNEDKIEIIKNLIERDEIKLIIGV